MEISNENKNISNIDNMIPDLDIKHISCFNDCQHDYDDDPPDLDPYNIMGKRK